MSYTNKAKRNSYRKQEVGKRQKQRPILGLHSPEQEMPITIVYVRVYSIWYTAALKN